MKKYLEQLKKKIDESAALDKVLIGSGKVLDVADRAADILVHMGPQMTAMGGVALASRVVSTMRDARLISAIEYFEKNEWVPLKLYGFESQAWRYAHAEDGATALPIPATYADEQAFIVDGLGVDIGFSMTGGTHGLKTNHAKLKAESCWVRSEADREAAMAAIGKGLWGNIGSTKALLVKQGEGIAVIPDDDEETLASRRGDEVYAKLKLYLDKGVHRSVFMIGEAGVGKSHMLRYIAGMNGGLVLRVKIADLEDVSPTKMVKTVELLRPDVFIIDDFDRFVLGSRFNESDGAGARNAAKMLDPLQQINRLVKLFMVSANYSDGINSAVLRPGRFDELVEVHELDPELYAKMLPDAPAKLIKALKKESPPIAYVAELKKRVDVLGYEGAAKEMDALIRRSGRILEMNAKKTRRKSSKGGRKRASLVGKTKYRQAILMEERAARLEKNVLKGREMLLRAEEEAQEWRDKAVKRRGEAEEEKAEAAKKKAQPKGQPKKKPRKKAKAKPKTAEAADIETTIDSVPQLEAELLRGLRGGQKVNRRIPKRMSVSKTALIRRRRHKKL